LTEWGNIMDVYRQNAWSTATSARQKSGKNKRNLSKRDEGNLVRRGVRIWNGTRCSRGRKWHLFCLFGAHSRSRQCAHRSLAPCLRPTSSQNNRSKYPHIRCITHAFSLLLLFSNRTVSHGCVFIVHLAQNSFIDIVSKRYYIPPSVELDKLDEKG